MSQNNILRITSRMRKPWSVSGGRLRIIVKEKDLEVYKIHSIEVIVLFSRFIEI
jgi:hypothetical protein